MDRSLVAAIALAAVCVAGAANAQTLNFDDVCAAPPCAAANAYQAPWGVTLAPAHSIVAGGVDQLVGRNGTKYLSVATAPYQATITLPRVATYASLQVSRSSLTAAGQTVSLQALRNGAPVGTPHTATLGDVDTWTVLRVNVANGFDALFVSSAFGSANRTFGIDDVRIAGHCAGFADVADSDIFCAAAEWLYNRGVTTGCTMGTYCPAAAVTRAQMALFMNRLADAVVPPPLRAEQSLGARTITFTHDDNPVCAIAVPHADFPRAFSITGSVMLESDSGERTVSVVVQAANDGVFLPSFGNNVGTIEQGKFANIPIVTSVTLPPGAKTIRLALAKFFFFTSDITVASGNCKLRVNAQSISGSSSPY